MSVGLMGGRSNSSMMLVRRPSSTSNTLDRFALKYNLEHVQHKMIGFKESRVKQIRSLQRTQAHSHVLYTSGRSLFENAVTQATGPALKSGISLPCIHSVSSTSPTYSPRFDNENHALKSKVLHAIRQCSAGRLHEGLANGTGDAIQQHIRLLNDKLGIETVRVEDDSTCANIRVTPTTNFSEVKLVPLYTRLPSKEEDYEEVLLELSADVYDAEGPTETMQEMEEEEDIRKMCVNVDENIETAQEETIKEECIEEEKQEADEQNR